MANYSVSAGSKLSYATITGSTVGTYTDLKALTSIPEIGQAPEEIDATSLDNLDYRSKVQGLIDTGVLEFPFNLEHPSATANINVVAGLDKTKLYSWKITYASGITVVFTSKPRYSFNAVGVNELETFTLYLTMSGEPEITVPTASL